MRRFATFLIAATLATPAVNAEQLWLTMDQVRPYELKSPAQSIVVGNPGIADVTVQDNQNLLLFGKAPGLTNIFIFDENGKPSQNLTLRVRTTNSDMLTVHRGSMRTSYNCTVNCEATVTVGDDTTTFSNISRQVDEKFSQAQGGGN